MIDREHALLRDAARGAARFASGDADRVADIEEELFEHLRERYEAELEAGAATDIAARNALRVFGEPRALCGRLYLRRLGRGLRAATQLPRAWCIVAATDAVALGVLLASSVVPSAVPVRSRAAVLVVGAASCYLGMYISVSLARFGLRELSLSARRLAPRVAGVGAIGLVLTATLGWLALVPSATGAVIRAGVGIVGEPSRLLAATLPFSALVGVLGLGASAVAAWVVSTASENRTH